MWMTVQFFDGDDLRHFVHVQTHQEMVALGVAMQSLRMDDPHWVDARQPNLRIVILPGKV